MKSKKSLYLSVWFVTVLMVFSLVIGGQTVISAKEIVFPDEMPEVPERVDADSYSYDDMSKKYEFEIMLVGHVNQPIADDRIKQYLEEEFNVELKLTNLPDDQFKNAFAVRFASGEPPEFIVVKASYMDMARNMFEQRQLIDGMEILPYMPQAADYVTKAYKQWATYEGDQLVGIPRYNTFKNNWGLFVRADWLEKFDMDVPETEDELFEYAKAVVNQDPDGNGEDDTYFMVAAAEGINFFMMEPLNAMYGYTAGSDASNFNVKDGKINHPMLDGTEKRFVKFIKKLHDNDLLHPDWFTMGWNGMQALRYNNQLGMVYYPGKNLIGEDFNNAGEDLSVLDNWVPLPPLKSNDGRGGKAMAAGSPGGVFVFTNAIEDEGELKRIAHLVDTCIYPNVNYWATSQGGGKKIWPEHPEYIEEQKFIEEDGTNIFRRNREKHPALTDPSMQALEDWQWIGYTLKWQLSTREHVGPVASKLDRVVENLPRYTNYELFLNLDPAVLTKVKDYQIQNRLKFILGNRSMEEWDKYVEEWKNIGGQELMKQAAEQLNVDIK